MVHLRRLLRVDHRLERLVRDPDRSGGSPRLLRLLGSDDRHGLAEVADALQRKHGLVAELEPVQLLSGNVLVGQDRVHSWKRAGLGGIDAHDARMRMGTADRLTPEHPSCVQVARVRELAGDLRYGITAPDRGLRVALSQRAGCGSGGGAHCAAAR